MTNEPRFSIGAKLEVKTELPSDASGRLVHAGLDAVSPLTEWLGMMGDKLRIHRRLAVARLIKQAEIELVALERPPHPIPLKVAIPLIEHASQEEPDDDFMIGMWARLLASAATSDLSISPRFVSILYQLGHNDAAGDC